MKKIFTKTVFSLLIQAILMGQAFSSSRVETVINEDRSRQYIELTQKLNDLEKQKTDLALIEQHLRLTNKGKSIYLKFETIAGALIGVGIVIGSYKAKFPAGFRAMVGAYVSVTGISRGLIKLSKKEATVILNDVTKLNKTLSITEISLDKQINDLCLEDETLSLCSEN